MHTGLRAFLSKEVTVVVDRPLGSRHPRHPDIVYPVNYGFVPGTVAGDGEPVDAYVLGVDEPVAEVLGTVVAIVVRADDVEDKLVVAATARSHTRAEIQAAVAFQERYFQSAVLMKEPCGERIS